MQTLNRKWGTQCEYYSSGNIKSFTYIDNKGQKTYLVHYNENGEILKEQSYIDLDKTFEQGKLYFDSSHDEINALPLLDKATHEFNKIIAVIDKKPDCIWEPGNRNKINPYSKFPEQTYKCSFNTAAVLYYLGAIEIFLAENSTNFTTRTRAYDLFARSIEIDNTFSPTYLMLLYAYYDSESPEIEDYWDINNLVEWYKTYRSPSEKKYLSRSYFINYFDERQKHITEVGTHSRINIEECYKKIDETIMELPLNEIHNQIADTKLLVDDLVEYLKYDVMAWDQVTELNYMYGNYFHCYQIYHINFTLETLIIKSHGVTFEINDNELHIKNQNKDFDNYDPQILKTSLDNLIKYFYEIKVYFKYNAVEPDERIENDHLYNLLLSIESDNIRYNIKN